MNFSTKSISFFLATIAATTATAIRGETSINLRGGGGLQRLLKSDPSVVVQPKSSSFVKSMSPVPPTKKRNIDDNIDDLRRQLSDTDISWKNLAIISITGAGLGTAGTLIGLALDVFWSTTDDSGLTIESIWEEIYDLVYDMVSTEIFTELLQYKVSSVKTELTTLYDYMENYETYTDKGSCMDTLVDYSLGIHNLLHLRESKSGSEGWDLATDSDQLIENLLLIEYGVAFAVIHLMILRERYLYGQFIYDSDQDTVWYDELLEYATYYDEYFSYIHGEYLVWADERITYSCTYNDGVCSATTYSKDAIEQYDCAVSDSMGYYDSENFIVTAEDNGCCTCSSVSWSASDMCQCNGCTYEYPSWTCFPNGSDGGTESSATTRVDELRQDLWDYIDTVISEMDGMYVYSTNTTSIFCDHDEAAVDYGNGLECVSTLLDVGEVCTINDDCQSGLCDGICLGTDLDVYESCSMDEQCLTGMCDSGVGFCDSPYETASQAYGEDCWLDADCQSNICNFLLSSPLCDIKTSGSVLALCDDDDDCGGTKLCTDGQCKKRTGKRCSKDEQCATGNCQNGIVCGF